MKEFRINEYLSVRLERGETRVYIAGQPFIQCKFLLLNIPITDIRLFDEIDSIDEAAEKIDGSKEKEIRSVEIPPEVEFWGHCSNLQVWYEHGYDTRLIHSNIAFPILQKLTEVGDPLAKINFKEELIKRYKSGSKKIKDFLRMEGFLQELSIDEYLNLILDGENYKALMELGDEILLDFDTSKKMSFLLECIKIDDGKIYVLDVPELDLKEFPKSIFKFESLEKLSIRNNCLKSIPHEIYKLKKLKELWIGSNEISHLPNSISKNSELTSLWADDNKLITLPDDFGNLQKLKVLMLSNNQIERLPNSFYRLKSLEVLSLANNKIKTIPDSFCKIESLVKLYLFSNMVKEIPNCITKLTNLTYLDISHNPVVKNPINTELLDQLKIKINKVIY